MSEFATSGPATGSWSWAAAWAGTPCFLAEAGVAVEGLDLSRSCGPAPGAQRRPLQTSPPRLRHHRRAKELYGTFDAVIGFSCSTTCTTWRPACRWPPSWSSPAGGWRLLEPKPKNPLYYFQIAFTPRWHGRPSAACC